MTTTRYCPLCRRPIPTSTDGRRRPDVVYSTFTKTYYCGGARYRRCAEIAARLRRAERRSDEALRS